MKRPCFQKILRWLRVSRSKKKERRGVLTLLSVFMFVIFTTLGLGMLYLTQVYLKISAYRKNSMLLEYASENGIKQGYDHLQDLLLNAASPTILTEDEVKQFLADSHARGNAVVQRVLGRGLPVVLEDSWERLVWKSLVDFQLIGLHEKEGYFRAAYSGCITSTGELQGFKPIKASHLDACMDIFVGHIPLPSIPFLLDKSMTSEQKKAFLEENSIQMISSESVDLPSPSSFSEGGLLPQQAVEPLANTLKIKIFHPQDLSAAKLRLALGLEVNEEPVPNGVYLIQDDLGLGGVFVQGDLDAMILAIQGNFQIIFFQQGQDLWMLRFSPEDGRTIFISPVEIQTFDLIPLGIIIVNGKILSLGGGYEDADGKILMAEQEEVPCVKRGVNLTIIASDEINLSSHLIYQGVTWKQGVPYVKNSDPQLIIHATGQDFLDGEKKAGEIVIGKDSPHDLKIHASMTASGNGVSVVGEEKNVQILGSLQTSELDLQENEISIKYDDRFFHDRDEFFQNAPHTKLPVLYLFRFKITGWRENL